MRRNEINISVNPNEIKLYKYIFQNLDYFRRRDLWLSSYNKISYNRRKKKKAYHLVLNSVVIARSWYTRGFYCKSLNEYRTGTYSTSCSGNYWAFRVLYTLFCVEAIMYILMIWSLHIHFAKELITEISGFSCTIYWGTNKADISKYRECVWLRNFGKSNVYSCGSFKWVVAYLC